MKNATKKAAGKESREEGPCKEEEVGRRPGKRRNSGFRNGPE